MCKPRCSKREPGVTLVYCSLGYTPHCTPCNPAKTLPETPWCRGLGG